MRRSIYHRTGRGSDLCEYTWNIEWNQSWIWSLHCSKKQWKYLHFSLYYIIWYIYIYKQVVCWWIFFKSVNSLGKQSGWQDPGVLQPSSTYRGERSHSALDMLANVWLKRKQCRRTIRSEMNFSDWPKKAREELNAVKEWWWNLPAAYCSDSEQHPLL